MDRIMSIHWKRPWCWERLEGKGRRGWQRVRWLASITDSMVLNLSKLWELVEDRGSWHAEVHGVARSWTELNKKCITLSWYLDELSSAISIHFYHQYPGVFQVALSSSMNRDGFITSLLFLKLLNIFSVCRCWCCMPL